MNEIPPITVTGVLAPHQAEGRRSQAPRSSGAVDDQVEISDLAQRLSEIDSGTRIRTDKVAQIREAIQNGTYETPEKIDATVSRLMDVLQQA
jgi:negative regulator of flagellin synthesis FlgM